jgi:CheY-like chemotaxis protein
MPAVLIIEDDASQRFVASFALKRAGHTVHEAADGPQGVEAAKAHKPDVIVCDVMMPGMTGYEVVAALRAEPATANVPVILLTAMSDRKHMRQGMTAGADDYLTKPYRPDELCEAIDAAMARRQLQQNAFINSVSDVVAGALDEQKESLGREYEYRLLQEVNARWTRKADETGDVAYPHAIVLLADVVGSGARSSGQDLAALTKKAQQAARDTLYLFGAAHVLPYGSELLAIFDGDDATASTSPAARAIRAAQGVTRSAPPERGVSVALHAGPVTLVSVYDGLHGERGHAVVPGDTMAAVAGLWGTVQASGWRMGASREIVKLAGGEAQTGRAAKSAHCAEALELLLPKAKA